MKNKNVGEKLRKYISGVLFVGLVSSCNNEVSLTQTPQNTTEVHQADDSKRMAVEENSASTDGEGLSSGAQKTIESKGTQNCNRKVIFDLDSYEIEVCVEDTKMVITDFLNTNGENRFKEEKEVIRRISSPVDNFFCNKITLNPNNHMLYQLPDILKKRRFNIRNKMSSVTHKAIRIETDSMIADDMSFGYSARNIMTDTGQIIFRVTDIVI